MWCSLCEASINIIKHLVTNRTMIDGCKSYKVETLKYHEESRGHQMAVEIYNNTIKQPNELPDCIRSLASRNIYPLAKLGKCNSNLASTILKQLAKMAR